MIKFIFLLIRIIAFKRVRGLWWSIRVFVALGGFLLMMEVPIYEDHHNYYREWGYDFIGFRLIVLSYWVRILIILSRWIIKKTYFYREYFIWLVLFLLLILEMCFISINILTFYIFFEISLIPTLLIILGWGFQLERLQAGIYFIFYTLTASLPLLLNLINFYSFKGLIHYGIRGGFKDFLFLREGLEMVVLLRLVMAFLVKLPIFFAHLWLPRAHVEAPVAGSIILAGVLLKLGGFGLCRVMPMIIKRIIKFRGWIISLGLIRIIYVGLVCCRMNDLKALVAYSSVAHIGLVFSGLATIRWWGVRGGLIIIVRHGLSSSGLFCVVNIFYERLRRRRIYINRGLLVMFPILRLLVFFLCAANISAPPTINLIGEIFLMLRVISFSKIIIVLFPLGSFLGAVFTLFFYSYTQHGKNYGLGRGYFGGKVNEFHCLSLHIIPLNFVIIKSEMFFIYLNSL